MSVDFHRPSVANVWLQFMGENWLPHISDAIECKIGIMAVATVFNNLSCAYMFIVAYLAEEYYNRPNLVVIFSDTKNYT